MIKSYLVHGCDRYRIDFRTKADGTIELYALDRPPDPHRGGVLQNHVYPDRRICVAAGREPHTMSKAEAIGQFWMYGYSAYIRDPQGVFPNKACRVNV